MKTDLPAYTARYLSALARHLKQPARSFEAARKLGSQAVKLGLETLDLAKIHEEALITLVLPHFSIRTSESMVIRAGTFFAEAITPIEETHRGAREANAHLQFTVRTLTQRTTELASSNVKLKREVEQRAAAERFLRTSEETSSALLKKSRRMQDELRRLSRQLLLAQEQERRKISRELHDVIAQTLTGINVRLAALKKESTCSTEEFQKRIADTQVLVEKSVDIVHRFARELRPAVLDELGLIPALRSFMKGFTEETGIRVSLKVFAGVEHSNGNRRTVLYRVAREALTNVARHATASHAEVDIQEEDGGIAMEIKDNGKGFHVNGVPLGRMKGRLGLLGMKERVEMVSGTFSVNSAPGEHTTVRAWIPTERAGGKKGRKPTH